jgi:hypothetical protein
MTVREILEKLANDFDVDKNELWRTTGGRIIIDQALTSLAEEVGMLREYKNFNNGFEVYLSKDDVLKMMGGNDK